MTQITTIIEQIETKTGDGAKGPWKLFKIKTREGWISTFDDAAGFTALSLKGGMAVIDFHIKQKDGYDNMVLDDIKASEAAPTTQTHPQTQQTASQGQPGVSKDKGIAYSYAMEMICAKIREGGAYGEDLDGMLKDHDYLAKGILKNMTKPEPPTQAELDAAASSKEVADDLPF
jgi:hypothetical protein